MDGSAKRTALDGAPRNLPVMFTSFIGRQLELADGRHGGCPPSPCYALRPAGGAVEEEWTGPLSEPRWVERRRTCQSWSPASPAANLSRRRFPCGSATRRRAC